TSPEANSIGTSPPRRRPGRGRDSRAGLGTMWGLSRTGDEGGCPIGRHLGREPQQAPFGRRALRDQRRLRPTALPIDVAVAGRLRRQLRTALTALEIGALELLQLAQAHVVAGGARVATTEAAPGELLSDDATNGVLGVRAPAALGARDARAARVGRLGFDHDAGHALGHRIDVERPRQTPTSKRNLEPIDERGD